MLFDNRWKLFNSFEDEPVLLFRCVHDFFFNILISINQFSRNLSLVRSEMKECSIRIYVLATATLLNTTFNSILVLNCVEDMLSCVLKPRSAVLCFYLHIDSSTFMFSYRLFDFLIFFLIRTFNDFDLLLSMRK